MIDKFAECCNGRQILGNLYKSPPEVNGGMWGELSWPRDIPTLATVVEGFVTHKSVCAGNWLPMCEHSLPNLSLGGLERVRFHYSGCSLEVLPLKSVLLFLFPGLEGDSMQLYWLFRYGLNVCVTKIHVNRLIAFLFEYSKFVRTAPDR